MPRFSLGTFDMDDNLEETIYQSIVKLKVKHIDTAKIYESEEGIGRALKRAF